MSVGMLWLWNKKCKHNVGKLADDPTKVTTKLGLSYANNCDFNGNNHAFFWFLYSLAQTHERTAQLNNDTCEL